MIFHQKTAQERGDANTKTTEKKAEFIELRAQGLSYDKIGKTLNISKVTCQNWEEELEAKISESRDSKLSELYELYEMHKAGRIKKLGETIRKIDEALEKKDLSEIPADKLLELKYKYEEKLQAEYIEPAQLRGDNSLEGVLYELNDLMDKASRGEISPQDVKARLSVINLTSQTLTKIDKATDLWGNLNCLRLANYMEQ